MVQYSFNSLQDEYRRLWARMVVTKVDAANRQARQVIAAKARYKAVEARTGVPWFVIGCLHMRESNGNFATYLGNGQPLNRRTTIVPKGRGPWATFEDGAFDALVTVEHLDRIREWGAEHVAYAMEKFNGFGYRHPARSIPSPYLWGGTSVQRRGKFVRDGVYDASVTDPQLGGMAVLKQIMALDSEARFRSSARSERPPEPEPRHAPQPEPERPSPAAVDTEARTKPLRKSKTIWGAVGSWAAGVGGVFVGIFEHLATPWGFAIFALSLVAISAFTWLVIKGRIDVNNVVKHLANDDDDAEEPEAPEAPEQEASP